LLPKITIGHSLHTIHQTKRHKAIPDSRLMAAQLQIAILNMIGSNAKYNSHIILQDPFGATNHKRHYWYSATGNT
jgi:hypothetical protein